MLPALKPREQMIAEIRRRAELELSRRRADRAAAQPSKELAEQSLYEYIKQAWQVLEPSTRFIDGWHIGCLAEHLEAITAGQITRFICNVPPRYMKSLNVSVCWPTWEWGPRRMGYLRYLFSSYSAELVVKHSVDRRSLISSAWYQRNWADRFMMLSDNNRKSEFSNNLRGVMSTTSTGAAATGKGGNRLVIDDPLNPEQAVSDTERTTANRHYGQTLYTRLDDKQRDAIVIIMQRLHTTDLVGHILDEKKEQGWTVLRLEAEAEERKVITFPTSKREVVREVGDPLWPEREPPATLAQTKAALGSYAYAGQYQQRPAPLEGGVIKREWFAERRFSVSARPLTFDQIILSGDLAFKDFSTSSRVALHIWGQIGKNKYLLDRICTHLGFTDTLTSIRRLVSCWTDTARSLAVNAILIEDKANGPAVIETLRKELPGVIAIEPDGSKVARLLAQSPQMEAGDVWISDEPWGDEVIDALCFVPTGDNWDDPDAMSQALKFMHRSEGVFDAAVLDAAPTLESSRADW